MTPESRYLLVLTASPAVSLLLHAVISRLSRVLLAPKLPPQLLAGLAVLAGYPAMALLAWPSVRALAPVERLGASCYGLVVYGGLAFCYFQVYNLSETARRIHILSELRSRGGLAPRELESHYAPSRLLSIRLERLVGLRQVSIQGGRYRLDSRALWLSAFLVDVWAVLIGYPSRRPCA